MPNQVDGVLLRTMSGIELSRVRTELHRRRILAAISPHPVQADSQPAPQVDGVLLRTMSGIELSRVRTELHRRRILAAISPHPVQADSQPAAHRYLGNAFVPTHRQVNVPTLPVRTIPGSCLSSLHQQEAQQGVALPADVP